MKVFPALIKRSKSHFHNLPCGASIILGKNGNIWISPLIDSETNSSGGFAQNLDQVSIRLHGVRCILGSLLSVPLIAGINRVAFREYRNQIAKL